MNLQITFTYTSLSHINTTLPSHYYSSPSLPSNHHYTTLFLSQITTPLPLSPHITTTLPSPSLTSIIHSPLSFKSPLHSPSPLPISPQITSTRHISLSHITTPLPSLPSNHHSTPLSPSPSPLPISHQITTTLPSLPPLLHSLSPLKSPLHSLSPLKSPLHAISPSLTSPLHSPLSLPFSSPYLPSNHHYTPFSPLKSPLHSPSPLPISHQITTSLPSLLLLQLMV